MRKGISIILVVFSVGSLQITADMPKISSTFKALLPRILPIIRSPPSGVTASTIVTASSGALVPTATTVTPIMNVEIRSFFAIPAAPSTKKSAPLTSRTKPSASRIRLTTQVAAVLLKIRS